MSGSHEVDEELPPSKLGTKQHWDEVYEREVRVFDDVGDEGEVWFGESSVTKMRSWAQRNLPLPSSTPIRILECGSGNGTLLLSFLTSPSTSQPQAYHLTGIDYSPLSATLSKSIESTRRQTLIDEDDIEENGYLNPVDVEWKTGDLLRDDLGEVWDLVLDKGTFDALCLSDEVVEGDGRLPSLVYPEKVARLVKQGGWFLITSCNFTEEEVKKRFTREGLGFEYHSSVPHPTFSFGGKKGSTVCTVAFTKVTSSIDPLKMNGKIQVENGHTHGEGSSTSALRTELDGSVDGRENGNDHCDGNGSTSGQGGRNGHMDDADDDGLYICVDCGGTKTAIAIANAKDGIIARATGGTGNMAEVGLQLSYQIIIDTVYDAIEALPVKYKSKRKLKGNGNGNGHGHGDRARCPIHFTDVWVGISGCDTPLDQKSMSDLLTPFFGIPRVPVLNDAHLLGGILLTHHCPWGIAVIAGTGSVVIGLEVAESGEVVQFGRRGGVGYLLGDDGSAFDLGRCAIRCAIDDFDAGLETPGGLAEEIRKHFGVKSTGEILAKVYDLDPTLSPIDSTNIRKLQISSLSHPILSSFSQPKPDPLATRAVHAAAKPLIESIISLARQATKDGKRKMGEGALMLGGGVVRQGCYRDVVVGGLEAEGWVFGVEEGVGDVVGEGVLGLVERYRERRASL